jgi:glycolate oxidase FAD binding subunit
MSASRTIALSQLADIAGQANTSSAPARLAAYAIDGHTPSLAVRPGSAEEVAEIVKLAAREKLAVIPSGARTKLGIGRPPRSYDLALDMTRLDRVVAYDPQDLTLSVEAGIPLDRIAAELAAHRQFLPLAVPFADRATAGGTIASGVDSPLRQAYGTARDFVLGMEFVTGDGTAAKSGGRVVKNVSGYDLHKLMIGALGTLGVITRINFRTFPLPRMARTYAAVFRGASAACKFRHASAGSVLRLESLELLAAGGAGSGPLGETAGFPFEGDRWIAVVSVAGNDEVLERSRRELELLARGAGGSSLESFAEISGEGREKAATYIRDYPAAILRHAPSAAIFKISQLPTELEAFAERCKSLAMAWAVMMRGLGPTYLALLMRDVTKESIERLDSDRLGVFLPDERLPTFSLLFAPPEVKRDPNYRDASRRNLALLENLKKAFDPSGVLGPGRMRYEI